jgi:antitoxin component YwqK of YwqJK toxin-antitoxin module
MIQGDRQCHQTELKDGRVVNQGRYVQWYPSGKVAVEGQFDNGEKTGTWVQYNEKGKKILEKEFDNGVEKASHKPAPTNP